MFAMSLFWRVPSKIYSTIYLEIVLNLSNTGKKNQNQNQNQKTNQAKQNQTKTNEGDMDFVDGERSGFPGLAKIILSKLKIRLIFVIS